MCRFVLVTALMGLFPSFAAKSGNAASDVRKAEYVHAVTRGAGFMPWQKPGISEAGRTFRQEIEKRKDELLAVSNSVPHPVL